MYFYLRIIIKVMDLDFILCSPGFLLHIDEKKKEVGTYV